MTSPAPDPSGYRIQFMCLRCWGRAHRGERAAEDYAPEIRALPAAVQARARSLVLAQRDAYCHRCLRVLLGDLGRAWAAQSRGIRPILFTWT